jgi:hypothetical protein
VKTCSLNIKKDRARSAVRIRNYHQQYGLTPEELDSFTAACEAEVAKIQTRQTDLAGTMATLEAERCSLLGTLAQIREDRTSTAQAFRNILEHSSMNTDGTRA